jgi:uncharacterized protein (TIGR02597 family)
VLHQEIEARHAETKSFKLKNTGKLPTPPLPAMKLKAFFSVAVLASAGTGFGQYATDPVGVLGLSVPPASDIAMGAPLGRPSEYQGVVQSVDSNNNTVTVGGLPGWSEGQFVYSAVAQPKTYFLRFETGSKEGLVLTIIGNTTNGVTVSLPAGESLSGISSNVAPVSPATTGDLVSIAPYWTVSTVFTGAIPGTLMLVPQAVAGINLPSTIYTFNGTNWIRSGAIADDVVLNVTSGFIVRNNSTTATLNLNVSGTVPMVAHRMRLATLVASTKQDIRFVYTSPIPEVIGTAFNSAALNPGDLILYVNNAATGKNKPTTTLTWTGSDWVRGGVAVTNTFYLEPGQSYLFRKNSTPAPSSLVWSDVQSYLGN